MTLQEFKTGLEKIGYRLGEPTSELKVRRIFNQKNKPIKNVVLFYDKELRIEISNYQKIYFILKDINFDKEMINEENPTCFSIGSDAVFFQFYNFDKKRK